MNIGGSPVSATKSVHEYWRFACFCYEECTGILEVRLFLLRRVCMNTGGSPVSATKSSVVCARRSVHGYWKFSCLCFEKCTRIVIGSLVVSALKSVHA